MSIKPSRLFSLWEKMMAAEPDLLEFKTQMRQSAQKALMPALTATSLMRQRISGNGWALIGDASGAVHSVSGGGIRYAFETAGFLAHAIISGHPELYRSRWRQMCKAELAGPALWGPIFYKIATQKILSHLLAHTNSAKSLVREILSGKPQKRKKIIFAFAKMFKEICLY